MDLFFKISTYGYVISGLIIVLSFISIIVSLIKGDKEEIRKTISLKSAVYFCCIAIVCAPLDFYWDTTNLIPEKTYYITTKLSIAGEKNPFSVDAKITYDKEVEYEEYESSMSGIDTTRTKTYVHEKFSLLDYSFNGCKIEDLPEIIESFGEYEILIWTPIDEYGNYIDDEDYSPRYGTIQFPAITKDNLGITQKDVLEAYGKINMAEHMAVFALGTIGLVLWLNARKAENT